MTGGVGASRRPLGDHEGVTWLGHPQAPVFRIEVADDALVFHQPSGRTPVPWERIRSIEVDIPTAPWSLARASRSLLAAVDTMQVATSDGVPVAAPMRFGTRDIEVRLGLDDGSRVSGWAQKHQPLGYPEPEVRAAVAVLQGRVRRAD